MTPELVNLVVRLAATNSRKALLVGATWLVTKGLATPDQANALALELGGVLAGLASVVWGNVTHYWQAKLLAAAHALEPGADPEAIRRQAGQMTFADLAGKAKQFRQLFAQARESQAFRAETERQLEALHRELAALRRTVTGAAS